MTAMTTTSTGSSSAFTGADVDGLDKVAQECTQAAQVCDEVRMACEIIVAAASFFGPFGAAFVAYLKGVVIPWLQKISQALQLFAKVLSAHSASQRNASSASTSLPSYTTPTGLPAASTSNYPVLPPTASTGGAAPVSSGVGGSVGSSAGGATVGGTTHGGATVAQSPAVQGITAVTALLTAIAKLENPGTATPATTPVGGTTAIGDPTGLSGTASPVATPVTLTGTTGTGVTGTGAPGTGVTGLGGLSGISGVSTSGLPAGDTVGMLNVPVAISPDGHITPLLRTTGPTTTPSIAQTTPHDVTTIAHGPTPLGSPSGPAHPSAAVPTAHVPTGGGGSGGGFSSGGTSGGGTLSAAPQVIGTHPDASVPATAVHAAAATGSHAAATNHAVPGHAGASHDGLYSGLGQATGIGAGGAALAKATLSEARQRAEGGLLSGLPLPFEAGSDGSAQLRIFNNELGG